MKSNVRRLFVEKKPEFNVEANNLLGDLRNNLGMSKLKALRIFNRYDISGATENEYEMVKNTIFSEKTVDFVYDENIEIKKNERAFAFEYLPGQYDQRADSAMQCIQILIKGKEVLVRSGKLIILSGNISEDEFSNIKDYCINCVDSREAELSKPETLESEINTLNEVEILEVFIESFEEKLEDLKEKHKLAMSSEDLLFCRDYFKNTEKRNPTITELKVIDTYWSDHCRHTTFNAQIKDVRIKEGKFTKPIKGAFESYLKSRSYVYEHAEKDICLMDLATIAMKELRKNGSLKDLDISEEINACSVEIDVDVDGSNEKWLLMFKNETHNHPTEIEPFGGAATCLGGAIRDPLSGRAYVYQAMRVTGSGDPREKIENTLKGKLPQRKITIGAAQGFSSYGNQIGLATGQVSEIYDEGFKAKRMEIGAVIGAAPKENVIRETPKVGDVIVLLGGKTGRDGCGGASGSSKEHDESSILTSGAEVQKGNAPTERKLQRLFRNPKVSKIIKRCNDFGAGGVSVAIGELADGLDINLDLIPKKYEGLDGTELAISESQERMAVVIDKESINLLISLAEEENIEATVVAKVTDNNRLRMLWHNNYIVDINRDFLNSNGVKQLADVLVKDPSIEDSYFTEFLRDIKNDSKDLKQKWLSKLGELNICSKRGLVERFDSTIGAGTVLMPFGGKFQATAAEGMAAKLPVGNSSTNTCSLMTYGYNPKIGKWSPFHGGLYSIVEAVTKQVAMGGSLEAVKLSLQEYFEKLGIDTEKWGKPFAALLGAFKAQKELGIAAIGGKDSMSGTYKELNVPPTLVAFAVSTGKVNYIISPEFKDINSKVVLIKALRDMEEIIDFTTLKKNLNKISELVQENKVLSACSINQGGICEAVSKMCFGNRIGFSFIEAMEEKELFEPAYGSMLLELKESEDLEKLLKGIDYRLIGRTQAKDEVEVNNIKIKLSEVYDSYNKTLEEIFPTKTEELKANICNISFNGKKHYRTSLSIARPRVFIPIFPGTNCEYDSSSAFEKAGAQVESFVFNNLTAMHIEQSIKHMTSKIDNSQIIMLPGGFSAGDEPDGSGKFIATVFRNELIKEAVMKLLKQRDGLILGICNGFQALIKLGLLPYGEIMDLKENSPTLTYNSIGRHVSKIVSTKITSNLSPWLANVNLGDVHFVPVSHGEGRFTASDEEIKRLIENGQIATQYVDLQGNATYDVEYNPNGSVYAVEGITSPDGRVFGKMAHSERIGDNIFKNIPGNKDQKLFEAGVNYFK